MHDDSVEPRTTLAIILGAGAWPSSPNLHASEAFTNSAQRFLNYLKSEDGFNLPGNNLLNLFDVEQTPDDMDKTISRFLLERQKQLSEVGTEAKDLLVYYVGHGGFTPGRQEYFLAIRTTRQDREGPSSIRISDLARTLKQDAKSLRRYLIFDCCFAASAYQEFQSSGPAEAARVKTLAEFPRRGTALLCASSARDVALAPGGQRYTMFSGALVEVLQRGDPELDAYFTLEQLGDRVREDIREKYRDEAVRPQVLSPDQREGSIADLSLFPNPAVLQLRIAKRMIALEQRIDQAIYPQLNEITHRIKTLTIWRAVLSALSIILLLLFVSLMTPELGPSIFKWARPAVEEQKGQLQPMIADQARQLDALRQDATADKQLYLKMAQEQKVLTADQARQLDALRQDAAADKQLYLKMAQEQKALTAGQARQLNALSQNPADREKANTLNAQAWKYLNMGQGVPTNEAEAARLYRKSADLENATGQYYLGLLYLRGWKGQPIDEAEAKKWLRKAADQGHPEAQKELQKLGSSR